MGRGIPLAGRGIGVKPLMVEINLDKKMTDSVSYVKLWTEVVGKFADRKDIRSGFYFFGRFV